MYDDICIMCKAAMHASCAFVFTGELPPGEDCCCGGSYNALAHLKQIIADDEDGMPAAPKKRVQNAPGGLTVNYDGSTRKRGDSGYIAPEAWAGPKDIGTLADPESTGRKRVKKMYPIKPGAVCEWANLAAAGGGVHPIIGCMGNAATDWHHGPDKNTLNNEKISCGIGDSENVHIICSFCHNAWHAINDPEYPAYDRNAQQTEPFLPLGEWTVHDPETQASFDALVATEKARRERDEAHGNQLRRRGRGGAVEFAGADDDADAE